uniref:Uncharacterized protein n=1 Tax=Lygus hesperus TaxID=30085 RepID=A0A0A9W8C1_LYGHE
MNDSTMSLSRSLLANLAARNHNHNTTGNDKNNNTQSKNNSMSVAGANNNNNNEPDPNLNSFSSNHVFLPVVPPTSTGAAVTGAAAPSMVDTAKSAIDAEHSKRSRLQLWAYFYAFSHQRAHGFPLLTVTTKLLLSQHVML